MTPWYRCVCGQTVLLHAGRGGACDACGRKYGPGVLNNADGAATTVHLVPSVAEAKGGPDAEAWPANPGEDAAGERSTNVEIVDSLIGRQLHHYRLEQRLGVGGMGAVYRALDESLQRYVAVKVLRRSEPKPGDSRHIQRLLQEAIALARVNHPHVVHIYYVGRDGDLPFFAMELVGGMTLAEALANGPLPYSHVVRLAIQIVDALEHAEQYDIVHGDLKPSNVLFSGPEDVKLADFGLARRLSESPENDGYISGTPNYLPPEVLAGQPLDVKSDQYSLGVTLFEMTFGRLPYSVTGSRLLARWRESNPPSIEFPEKWPAEIPQGWRRVLERLLSPDPARRYGDYGALRQAILSLKPLAVTSANRIPRFLAWMTDMISVAVVLGLVLAPVMLASGRLEERGLPALAGALEMVGLLVPVGFAILQAYWKTSLGKVLFQLRIVDRHGLAPSCNVLAFRALAQIFPLVVGSMQSFPHSVLLSSLGNGIEALGLFVFLVDGLWGMLSRDGRSLHDRLFDTRVVLDARA